MSENSETTGPLPTGPLPTGAGPQGGTAPGPQPETLRFFGTTWVDHDGGYALRRAGVAAGSLAAAVASCAVLRFAFSGLAVAEIGTFLNILVVLMFAVCSAVAYRKTSQGFRSRPADPAREDTLRGLRTIGFVGSLLAYFVRSLREAPGEGLLRAEYETALARYTKRRTTRTGNPAARTARKAK
ncbi:hypothetical protein [Streptomyces sp. NPDC060198]|uniref:hypothetical protein n=1 Tax=Streptomyces sp. NPDC060198 TaxID=3347070 RepID=UPI0036581FD7